jgi:hypothetical protein
MQSVDRYLDVHGMLGRSEARRQAGRAAVVAGFSGELGHGVSQRRVPWM